MKPRDLAHSRKDKGCSIRKNSLNSKPEVWPNPGSPVPRLLDFLGRFENLRQQQKQSEEN